MDSENSLNRPSGLRPPSRLPALSSSATAPHGLHEISESQTNSRAIHSMMPQPKTGMKRSLQNPVPHSSPKRAQTMAERAGTDFPLAKSHLTAPAPARSIVKGASLKDMVGKPPVTGSRSTYQSNTSRHTSNNSLSHATSVGPGGRPPSRSHARSASVRSTASRYGRPATSMELRKEEQNNNNGMPPPPPGPLAKKQGTSALPLNKLRKYHSEQDMALAYTQPLSSSREASICEQFGAMSLSGRSSVLSNDSSGSQVNPSGNTSIFSCSDSGVQDAAWRNENQTVSRQLAVRVEKSQDIPVAPKTPTAKQLKQQLTRVDSTWKAVKTPGRGFSPSPTKSPYLTKHSNVTGFIAWDVDERLGNFESEFKAMKDMINNSINGQKTLEEDVAAVRLKASELEQLRDALETKKSELQSDLDNAEKKIYLLERELEDEKRARRNEIEDLQRDHRNEFDSRERDFSREKDELERSARRRLEELKEEMAADFAKQLKEAHQAFEELEKLLEEEKRNSELRSEANGKDLEAQITQLQSLRKDLEHAKRQQDELNARLDQKDARIKALEDQVIQGHNELVHLRGGEQKQLEHFRIMSEEKRQALEDAAAARREAEEAKAKLRVEETRRRKLFEQLQTLKGNIRVMCRIRPGRNDGDLAKITTDVGNYDDHIGKMTVMVPSKNYLEKETLEPRLYDFERVFEPRETNGEIFGEISQLVQSALDGQKVCIFCYGQTGSGKTYTMSAGQGAIIPSAMRMIYEQVEHLKDAGWTYEMKGSFTEVYNEKLYDLLGKDDGKNQVELRQDPVTKKYFVDSEPTYLRSPEEVQHMLDTAARNRSVASTKLNRESSRSHSVFTLRLSGVDVDGHKSEGVLNLIDLAGSERVKESQVEGQTFREAASINTSLSTLSQVMMALAEGAGHIPYRNSALTKMLESCLGEQGAKVLMFVMVSPLREDVRETISSLDFATTVSKAKPGQSSSSASRPKSGFGKSSVMKKR